MNFFFRKKSGQPSPQEYPSFRKAPAEETSSSAAPAEQSPQQVKEEKSESSARFSARQPVCRFERLILAPEVRHRIDALLARIRHHRMLYEEWNLQKIDPQGRHVAVNFYGASGTGKTMCAEALAAALEKPIIEVSYAELESKYVGETSKNIQAAFRAATEQGAVLFFDEADSLLGKRLSNVTQASDHAVNTSRSVMLKQLDAFEGIVVFASNLVESFDRAFVRRILEHIELPLPGEAELPALWQHFIVPRITGRDALDWPRLASFSAGFSPALILDAVKLACGRAVTEAGETAEPVLTMAHLEDAIAQIARAREVVGVHGSGNR